MTKEPKRKRIRHNPSKTEDYFSTGVALNGDSSHREPLANNPSVRVLSDASSFRLVVRRVPLDSSRRNVALCPVPQTTNNVRRENISRSNGTLPAATSDVSRRVQSLPPALTIASRVGNTFPSRTGNSFPPATKKLSRRGSAFPSTLAKTSRRGNTLPATQANVPRADGAFQPATTNPCNSDKSSLANNVNNRPKKRNFDAVSDSPVETIGPSVSLRKLETASAAPSSSPPVFQDDPALPNNSLTAGRQSSDESAPSVDHDTNALALITAPTAVVPRQTVSSAKPKENEATALKKKLMNIAALDFQAGLQRIILSLGQLNGRGLPKSKLCMLQLCILMHSGQCKKQGGCCPVPQCAVMKDVLNHIGDCAEDKCTVAHCRASKQLISHWNMCHKATCDACRPILDNLPDLPKQMENNVEMDLPVDDVMSRASSATVAAAADPSSFVDEIGVDNRLFSFTQALTTTGNAGVLSSKACLSSPDIRAWDPKVLHEYLMPILVRLWNFGPAAEPFKRPVDPVADRCPDYKQVIKNPMDMSTINFKLQKGDYENPWEFVDDIYLMFRNAWTYNHRTSKYFAYATKLADAFEAIIDGVMQRLGYCCGHRYTYTPLVIYCDSSNSCAVGPYSRYYELKHGDRTYKVCENCHTASSDIVKVIDESSGKDVVFKKSSFTKMRNCIEPPEQDVRCVKCGRRFHSVCVMYTPELWPFGYVCKSCAPFHNGKFIHNKFSARTLPETQLSRALESRVLAYLNRREIENPRVYIRVLASSVQESAVLPKFKKHYPESCHSFKYVAKAIYAFQEQDGDDVCFFGMHVQEYGSDAASPNTRCVYLAYLDSVNYFKPSDKRTGFYHELLLGYMAYVKKRGFEKMFIWSCPPSPGDDYIFYCHPLNQKTPKAKRLCDWYKKVLHMSAKERTIHSYKDIYTFALEENIKSAKELPYFCGDYLPSIIEELVGEMDNEKDEEGDGKKVEKQKKKKPSKAKGMKTRSQRETHLTGEAAMTEKLYSTLKKNREMYLTIQFYPPKEAETLPPITDVDVLCPNGLVNNRSSFLLFAREHHYEFSTLRRAKFSTQSMLYELDRLNSVGIVCDSCAVSVGNTNGLLFCPECDNYQLCIICYSVFGHEHKMRQMWCSTDLTNRRPDLESLARALEHAADCQQTECPEKNCSRFKTALLHIKTCRLVKPAQRCSLCRSLLCVIIYHSRSCTKQNCKISFCEHARTRQDELSSAQRDHEARIMRRRMQKMATGDNTEEQKENAETCSSDVVLSDKDLSTSGKGSDASPRDVTLPLVSSSSASRTKDEAQSLVALQDSRSEGT